MSLGLVARKVARELQDTHIGWMDQRGEQRVTLVLVKVRVERRRSFVRLVVSLRPSCLGAKKIQSNKSNVTGSIADESTGTSVCNQIDRRSVGRNF